MFPLRKTILASFACLTLMLTASVAAADTVVIGGTGGLAARAPFGQLGGTTPDRYEPGFIVQQIYNSDRFAGPVTITQLAFSSVTTTPPSSQPTTSTFVSEHRQLMFHHRAQRSPTIAARISRPFTTACSSPHY